MRRRQDVRQWTLILIFCVDVHMGLDLPLPSTCVHLSLTPLRVDVIHGWPKQLMLSSISKTVSCLCLLDISAVIRHYWSYSILLQRLSSWFGVSGTALVRLQYDLSTRFFSVKAYTSLISTPSAPVLVSSKAPSLAHSFSSCVPLH